MNHQQMKPSREHCRKTLGLVGPFLDGELDAASLVDVDAHLSGCSGCREHVTFQRALKVSLKRATVQKAPDALRARLQAAFAAERAATADTTGSMKPVEVVTAVVVEEPAASLSLVPSKSDLVHVPRRGHPWLRRVGNVARTWVPVSAAAAALLFAYSTRHTNARDSQARIIPRGILGDMVAEHSHPLPPERTDPSGVRALERYVGVPVNLPFANAQKKARLVGARIMPLQSERAAMLQYEVDRGGSTPQRVSVFIYDPARIHVDGDEPMNAVGASRVGRQNGYSVAVTQHNGVGYAVASDLDPEMTAELANNVE